VNTIYISLPSIEVLLAIVYTIGPTCDIIVHQYIVGVAKSEHPRLTNDEIIFEEFQPM